MSETVPQRPTAALIARLRDRKQALPAAQRGPSAPSKGEMGHEAEAGRATATDKSLPEAHVLRRTAQEIVEGPGGQD